MFCPSEHVPLVGGARIVAVIPLGIQPIFDLTVEDTSTYLCAGIVHHNTGKALRNGTPVATPDGWVPIEQLKPGDLVLAGDGSPTRVVGVYPQGEVDLLRFTFDGGQFIDCCGNHLWKLKTPAARWGGGDWTIAKASDIAVGCDPKQRPIMPQGGAWQLPHKVVPVDPYLLGALLGDGGLTKGVMFSTADAEMVGLIAARLPDDVAIRHRDRYDYVIAGRDGKTNSLIAGLRALGQFGKKAHEKRVPFDYLTNDIDTRLEVLRGLMDTDGSVDTKNLNVEFCTVSEGLARDVQQLVESLGGRAKIKRRTTHFYRNGERVAGRESYRVAIRIPVCPFRLARKAALWMQREPMKAERVLHSIAPAGRGEATCIAVEHPDHTFITEHGIVTHNTWGVAAYELTCHLTGEYPPWWNGRVFKTPIDAWVCGDTRETVRDIIQAKLLGDVSKLGEGALGTGMIPRSRIIGEPRYLPNTNRAADYVLIKHVSGGHSVLGFKAYEQGRKAFQGTEKHVIVLDEEPPQDVYQECLMRGRTVDGITILTFTPLSGHTDVVRSFLNWQQENAQGASKALVRCSWDDVPHLDEKWKRDTEAATPMYMREARKHGIPVAGAGRIYPVEESMFVIKPVPLRPYWRRCFGFDAGWHNTAAVWLAYDKDEDIAYLYSEYKRGEQPIEVHAAAIRARGEWIPGRGDAASRDGNSNARTIDLYRGQGIKLRLADKGVDAGIQQVLSRLITGRLKVFNTCQKWLEEFRTYSYDEKGNIVKRDDHLMDATRYAVVSGLAAAAAPIQQALDIQELKFGLR